MRNRLRTYLGSLACKWGFHREALVHSEYVSFNWRRVYYQCQRECCKRVQPMKMHHDLVFPFPTSDESQTREFLKSNALNP